MLSILLLLVLSFFYTKHPLHFCLFSLKYFSSFPFFFDENYIYNFGSWWIIWNKKFRSNNEPLDALSLFPLPVNCTQGVPYNCCPVFLESYLVTKIEDGGGVCLFQLVCFWVSLSFGAHEVSTLTCNCFLITIRIFLDIRLGVFWKVFILEKNSQKHF